MGAVSKQQVSACQTACVSLLGAAILLVLPTLNGGPFFYFDTITYIEQLAKAVQSFFPSDQPLTMGQTELDPRQFEFGLAQSDKTVKGGRSIYYSVPAYLGWVTTIWFPVAIQAMALSWLIVKLFQCTYQAVWVSASIFAISLVSFLSSAAFFAGLIMPDIWVGMMVIALALVWVFGENIPIWTRLVLFSIIAFSVLSHKSHLALLASLILIYAGLQLVPAARSTNSKGTFTIPMLALVTGVVGHLAFSLAVQFVYKRNLVELPHITAHIVDLGPGARFAAESCPDSGFAICDYSDRLPVHWIAFLFDANEETGVFAVAPPVVQEALMKEQLRFAFGTLLAEPTTLLKGLIGDSFSQLWTITMSDVPLGPSNERYIATNFPTDLTKAVQRTEIYQNPKLALLLNRIIQITSIISTIVIILWIIEQLKTKKVTSSREHKIREIAIIIVLGVVINALICGALASPYGRFQARIVWLIPLLAAFVWTERSFYWPKKAKENLDSRL